MTDVNGTTGRLPNPVAISLIHWPILDGAGNQVAGNITNFDIHDIARAAKTYAVDRYFIVHRLPEQLMFVSRILDHWRVARGYELNPKRREALDLVQPVDFLSSAIKQWNPGGKKPIVVATAARDLNLAPPLRFRELREEIFSSQGRPVMLVFGTGFGLHNDIFTEVDFLLEPIRGPGPKDFRHLSVRSAVSICLDRLLASW